MILFAAFGFYKALGSFNIGDIYFADTPLITKLPFIFIGLVYVLTRKLRKSPFDLSMSHHGHQELVKGVTTEMTGRCFALVEIMHWFDTVFAMGLVYIFFVSASPYSPLIALLVCAAVYFGEVLIDNTFSRVRWQLALKLSWIITLAFGSVNIFLINMVG
jgi:ech hydrogenase subunit B